MNPENIGEQIKMRHSSMWRQPLVYEKSVPKASTCHTQMNQLGATGVSWRVRNNSISTHSNFNQKNSIVRKTNSKELAQILKDSKKASNQSRLMTKSLREDADLIDRSEKLINGIQDLKRMNLLATKDLQKVKFPGVGKYTHIYNDYHERSTNPGFSRNFLGRFYNK